MTLGCSDKFVMFSLLDFEALFVIVIYDIANPLLIYVFAPFSPKKLHNLFEWNISAWFKSETLLHCSVPKHPW